ncbi:MAG: aminopeptidase [Halodesulfurarchaeum sp.]
MRSVEEMRGARIVVEEVGSVDPGESVLVATDWRSTAVAERIAAAAVALDAQVTMTSMKPRVRDGSEPTKATAAAMKEVDVIFTPVSRGFSHSSATREALEAGARFVDMIRFTREQLVEGGLYADFKAIRPRVEDLAAQLSDATRARVRTPAGTDATFGLDGRRGNSHPCIADEPGAFTGAFNVEANTAPVEGTTEGTLVFDASIPHLDIGLLEEPVVMTVEDGSVVSVDGGRAADRIERTWSDLEDPAVTTIAQLAIGMNPECVEFDGTLQNDHGVSGSVHVGIGTSANLGGETKAPLHFDAMMADPTVTLDGTVVVEDGEIVGA